MLIIPKYLRKILYGKLKKHVREVIREVCRQRGIELVEGHPTLHHIHLCLSISHKRSVAFAIGLIKSKFAVRSLRQVLGHKKVARLHFRSHGYFVSTVGLNEESIRRYIREQEGVEKRQGELEFAKLTKT